MIFYFKTRKKRRIKRPNLDYKNNKEKARKLILSRLAYLNSFYNFNYGRVSVRDQSTRWGSCSKQGNLNFNYRLIHLPLDLCDYVILHELCHLKEFNHAKAFWDLLSKTCPDWREKRRLLKNLRIK